MTAIIKKKPSSFGDMLTLSIKMTAFSLFPRSCSTAQGSQEYLGFLLKHLDDKQQCDSQDKYVVLDSSLKFDIFAD